MNSAQRRSQRRKIKNLYLGGWKTARDEQNPDILRMFEKLRAEGRTVTGRLETTPRPWLNQTE